MKALLRSSLILVLAAWASRASAEEIQWRSAQGTPAPGTPAVRLSLPFAADGPAPAAAPVSMALPMIVRAKNQDVDTRPLPAGPSLIVGEPIAAPRSGPIPIRAKQVKSSPVSAGEEIVPNPPAVIDSSSVPPGPFVADGCGDVSGCDDCCDSCRPLRRCGLLCRGAWDRLCTTCNSCPLFRRCSGDGCDSCDDGCCGPRPRAWLGGSYLLWDVDDQDIPVLLYSNPLFISTPDSPGSGILFDGDRLETNVRNGGRFYAGFWFPRHDNWGMDITYFFLSRGQDNFFFGTNTPGSPNAFRPFTDELTGRFNIPVSVNALGQIVSGSFAVNYNSNIWGLDPNFRRKLWCNECAWVDGLIGYRHLNVDESLTITDVERVRTTSPAPFDATVREQFNTENVFNGFQLGLQAERKLGRRWFIQGTAKVALGNLHQSVDANGYSTQGPPGQAGETRAGSYLVQSTNFGRQERDRFSVVPELGVKFGLDVTQNLRVFAGYDTVFVSDVLRPGEQIDTTTNKGNFPFPSGATPNLTPTRPRIPFRESTLSLSGVNFGLELRY